MDGVCSRDRNERVGQMTYTFSPRLRTFALTTHIIVSVGWIGAVVAYLALDVTVATSQDEASLRAAYLGMRVIAWYAIVPLAVASTVTGLVMALGTRWGLFRHYWVLISLMLTVLALAVLLVELGTIDQLARTASDPSTSRSELRSLGSTLPHSGGGLVLLIVITTLNVSKPRGVTPYGWRKLQEEGETDS